MLESGPFPRQAAPFGAACLFLALSACSTSGSFHSAREIDAWAARRGFAQQSLPAGTFRLAALVRKAAVSGATLNVYIEGDGAAWPTPWQPPRDPTPTRPLALALAAADPAVAVVYLGRPCQYLDAATLADCDSAYWTERRFAPEVVAAYEDAVDRLKAASGAHRLRLFGYSGGGVIATLLAAQRSDVELLVTVAAPLALADWVAWHAASPLKGSHDPAALGENVRLPPAVHFVGDHDSNVPGAIVEAFVRRHGGRLEVVAGFDHDCCWARDWVALLGRATDTEERR